MKGKYLGEKKWKYGKNLHGKKKIINLFDQNETENLPETLISPEICAKSRISEDKTLCKKKGKNRKNVSLVLKTRTSSIFFFTPFKHQISPESSYFGPKRFKLTLILRHGWVLGELRARKRRKRQTSRRIEHENASFFAAQVVKWRQLRAYFRDMKIRIPRFLFFWGNIFLW